jgi:hypothetical protein
VFFVLSEYWPYVGAALLAGGVVGWWLMASRLRRDDRSTEAEPE